MTITKEERVSVEILNSIIARAERAEAGAAEMREALEDVLRGERDCCPATRHVAAEKLLASPDDAGAKMLERVRVAEADKKVLLALVDGLSAARDALTEKLAAAEAVFDLDHDGITKLRREVHALRAENERLKAEAEEVAEVRRYVDSRGSSLIDLDIIDDLETAVKGGA